MCEGNYLVLFRDNTCEEVYCKDDLISILSKDHIKPVRYVFSMADRIVVDREIYINTNESGLMGQTGGALSERK